MESVLGVILAGGKSSRMGEEKAALLRNNESMLAYTHRILKSAGINRVTVSGDKYDVSDIYPNLGPLSGIFSVLKKYQPEAMLIVPIDLPFIDEETLKPLMIMGASTQLACSYDDHSLPLYLPNSGYLDLWLTNRLKQSSNKGPSFKELFAAIPSQKVKLANAKALTNCNTPKQWQLANQQIELDNE